MAQMQHSRSLHAEQSSPRRRYSPTTLSESTTITNVLSTSAPSKDSTSTNTSPLASRWTLSKHGASSSRRTFARLHLRSHRLWRYIIITSVLLLLLLFTRSLSSNIPLATMTPERLNIKTSHSILQPVPARGGDLRKKKNDPAQWLIDYSDPQAHLPSSRPRRRRPRAALISLVRNEELDGILQSMDHLEFYWNRRHRYPWIFFNEKPFSEEFKVR